MISDKVKDFLNEIESDYIVLPSDLHITRKASALVAISNGRVIRTQKPEIKYCPLFKRLFDHAAINEKAIEDKFAKHTIEWGMFTSNRKVCDEKIIVPFGASEMLMYALKRKNIDAAVTACDGAGTVITSNPAIVQGIGAYMNGLFYTTPIKDVIDEIKKNEGFVLSEEDAEIDQYKGVRKAIEMGSRNIAVTARGDEADVIKAIRHLEKDLNKSIKTTNTNKSNSDKVRIVILAICSTGISKEEAEKIRDYADLAWACASKFVREIVGPGSILQVGMKIPVFILTRSGLDFISSYSSDLFLAEELKDIEKKHYITANRYEKNSIKISMGKFSVFLYETGSLPKTTAEEPEPLI